MGLDYKEAGVDVEAGYKAVALMKDAVQSTYRKEVLSSLGGFAGAFSAAAFSGMKDPVLLSGTDGVGTKLKIAFDLDKHDTIGIDCVAMCVNDVAAAGGDPLFFLDYIACGKNNPEKIAQIVSGIAEGCRQAGCALIGGETAEHPGMMPEDEYDLAGFTVGVAERDAMIDGASIVPGDVLIGLKSSGVHSNGFSLVRRILADKGIRVTDKVEEFAMSAGEQLLVPTRIYVRALRALKDAGVRVKGISHITGGGFYENIPRMLPDGTAVRIEKASYEIPPVFAWLQRLGDLSEETCYGTYNMGLGMVLALAKEDADKATGVLQGCGEVPVLAGEVTAGQKEVVLC